MNYLSKKLIYC